ncbi:ArsB/NhaD family transporter [soil metagenome]
MSYPSKVSPLGDLLGLAALAGLLIVAYRHPRARTEIAVSLAAAAAVLGSGAVSLSAADDVLRRLLPVTAFLITILVVAAACDRGGLFAAASRLLRQGGAVRLFTIAIALSAVVTTVLSLDATIVLLTPVLIGAAVLRGLPPRPAAYASLRMANSASLLLPVSNLTNLLALPATSLTFSGFAAAMAPAMAVVMIVEYVGLRLLLRRDLAAVHAPAYPAPPQNPPPTSPPPAPLVPAVVVIVMLAGFAVASELGIDLWWISSGAAIVLVGWGRRTGALRLGEAARSAQPGFALFVLALGLVVAALSDGVLGDVVASLVPGSTSYVDLLVLAAVATVLANLVTNLSATLLLLPLVAPLGDTAVLVVLVGVNAGAGLTMSGSLATLLWRRTLALHALPVRLGEFHRVSLLLTPVTVVVAVTAVYLTNR